MVKRTEVTLTCDVCGRVGGQTWLVGTPEGERAKVDLCHRCDDPMRKAFIAGRRNPGLTGPQGADIIHAVRVDDYQPSNSHSPPQVNWTEAQEKRHRG